MLTKGHRANVIQVKMKVLSIAKLGLISLLLVNPISAESDDDDFFALPSPNEILLESESEGLEIKINKNNSKVLRTDLKELGKKDKIATAFAMGRIFAITGFSFKKLNTQIILNLAQKIYTGAAALELPSSINDHITLYYQKMLRNPKWTRSDLLISFTSARSSLMYFMKDPKKVSVKERPRVQTYATGLELGLWYQSVFLATEHLKPDKFVSFADIYLDEDVIIYFNKYLKRCLEHVPNNKLLLKLLEVNQNAASILEDEKIEEKEVQRLLTLLKEVIR